MRKRTIIIPVLAAFVLAACAKQEQNTYDKQSGYIENFISTQMGKDATATLTRKNDSIYILRQESGSTLKVPKNSKWQKIPKTIELKRRK